MPTPTAATLIDAAPPGDAIDVLPEMPADAAPLDASTAQLTWVVSPPSVPDKHMAEMLLAPLDLEITLGADTKHVKLEPQFGALSAINQVVCNTSAYPLGKRDVAKITFYEGGAGGYVARRKGSNLVVLSWNQTDGLCGSVDKPVECPNNEKQVFQMPLPTTAKVTERIVEVDAKGVRHTFDCAR